jgi:5-hydroxyisourate hydrolase/2-oxo-4-hydroxy-4-carboxy-5-ureidoimidazoline decarboxylase
MNFKEFNKLSKEELFKALEKCCVSKKWIDKVIEKLPFSTTNEFIQNVASIWYNECSETDWKEAFKGHPKIGDIASLKEKFANTKNWASNEQVEVANADEAILKEIAKVNDEYFNKFGYIFIVSASGKSAYIMLQIIKTRLQNNENEELNVAMGEQHKITVIRLLKLITNLNENIDLRSYITTHVLDTTTGIPGKEMLITMNEFRNNNWQPITTGITNSDGRITDLLPAGKKLKSGNYQMVFNTKNYYESNNQKGFYPKVCIEFTVSNHDHYHVPLLINPFGYSTYKGS